MSQLTAKEMFKAGIEYGALRKEFQDAVEGFNQAQRQPNKISAPLESLEYLLAKLRKSYERSKTIEKEVPSIRELIAENGQKFSIILNSEIYESFQKQREDLLALKDLLPNRDGGRTYEFRIEPPNQNPNQYWS